VRWSYSAQRAFKLHPGLSRKSCYLHISECDQGTPSIATLRRTSRVLIISWFFGGFALAVLGLAVHRIFLIPLFALFVLVGIWTMRLRCSRCGHPIHKYEATVAGVRFFYWAPWIPKRCSRCNTRIP